MVAQRDHGRARRGEAERGDRRVLDPAAAGRDVALQFCRDQSGSAAAIVRERRRQFRARLAKFPQRLAASGVGGTWRSEEHTSELQSLMRISYAVFCLKK